MRQLTQYELHEAKRWVDTKLPESVVISTWLSVNLHRLGKVGTSDNAACYVDQWPHPAIVAGIDLIDLYNADQYPVYTIFISNELADETVENFLMQLAQVTGVLEIGGLYVQATTPKRYPIFDKVFEHRLRLGDRIERGPSKVYWMTEESRHQVVNRDVEAPKGFEFDSLQSSDAQYADDVWLHQCVGSEKLIERRILHFPTVCLRQSGLDKRLACFEMVNDGCGLQSHLYTVPEFRRQGLANLVELKLTQEMIKRDHIPAKSVALGNISGEKVTEASPLWTHAFDAMWLRYGDERMVEVYDEIDSHFTMESK